MDINNKKILLMMPHFYDLANQVKNELINQGAEIIHIESKILKEDYKNRKDIASFLSFILNPFYKKKYTQKVIQTIKGQKFDVFFVIGIYAGKTSLIDYLKSQNKEIKTVIYFWDAFITWDFSQYINKFDYRYSFDRLDCMKYENKNLFYLPLFYVDDTLVRDKKYDIVHIGTLGPKYNKRIFVLNQIFTDARRYSLNVFIRSYANLLNSSFFTKRSLKRTFFDRLNYASNKLFRNHIKELKKYKNSGIIFDTILDTHTSHEIEKSAKCILDINIENAGIAYRVINSLANRSKVITTNKHIKDEVFYHPDNILIIDKHCPVLDTTFMNKPFKEINISQLKIDNWLKTIFNFPE